MSKFKPAAQPTPSKPSKAKTAPIKPPAMIAGKAKPAAAKPSAAPIAPTGKPAGGKLGIIVALLSRKEGATIADLTTATGWQAHSVRGAMSGGLKNAGHTIERTRSDGVSTYRVRT